MGPRREGVTASPSPPDLTFGAESAIKECACGLARVIEQTRMVVSFAAEPDFTDEAIREMGDFMRRFKRETNQDSVALVVDGEMYYL